MYVCMHACMYVYAGKYMYPGLRKLYVFVCVCVRFVVSEGVGHHDQGSKVWELVLKVRAERPKP